MSAVLRLLGRSQDWRSKAKTRQQKKVLGHMADIGGRNKWEVYTPPGGKLNALANSMNDEIPRCLERGPSAADHKMVGSRIAITWVS
jgi:hypothetical protein